MSNHEDATRDTDTSIGTATTGDADNATPTDLTAAAAGARRVPGVPFPISRRTDPVAIRPGARVIVRRLTGQRAESGRAQVTDVIGRLESIDPLVVTPQTRSAARTTPHQDPATPSVEIEVGEVVVLKTLSAKPVRNSDIRAVEEAIAHAFPGIANEEHDGWLCRAGDGITERSNSAVPLGPTAGMQPVPVDAIADFYARHELPTQLLVPDRIGRTAEHLAGQRSPEILVMTRPLATDGAASGDGATDAAATVPGSASGAPAAPSLPLRGDATQLHPNFAGKQFELTVDDEPSEEWLSRYHFRGEPFPPEALELLSRRIDGQLGFAQISIDGVLVAITRATITSAAAGSRTFLGYSAVEVHPDYRRHGLGTFLGQAVLDWGAVHGAEEAYLEVIESNIAGRGMYEQLGFSEHHRHHSLILD